MQTCWIGISAEREGECFPVTVNGGTLAAVIGVLGDGVYVEEHFNISNISLKAITVIKVFNSVITIVIKQGSFNRADV